MNACPVGHRRPPRTCLRRLLPRLPRWTSTSCGRRPGSCWTSPASVRNGGGRNRSDGEARERSGPSPLRYGSTWSAPSHRCGAAWCCRRRCGVDELHGVLQAVFGWSDSHLHRFSLGDSAWDDGAERFLCPFDVEEGEDDGVPACDVRLDEVLAEPGDRLPLALHLRLRRRVESPPRRGAGRRAGGRGALHRRPRCGAAGGQRRDLGLGRGGGTVVRPG